MQPRWLCPYCSIVHLVNYHWCNLLLQITVKKEKVTGRFQFLEDACHLFSMKELQSSLIQWL